MKRSKGAQDSKITLLYGILDLLVDRSMSNSCYIAFEAPYCIEQNVAPFSLLVQAKSLSVR